MNTAKMSKRASLEAFAVWNTMSGFSYQNGNARHGINRNVTILESIVKSIRLGLDNIRDNHINKDSLNIALEEQKAYLEEEEEIPYYKVRLLSLEPCWRYVVRAGAHQAEREHIFMSAAEQRAIEYALIMPVYEEPTE